MMVESPTEVATMSAGSSVQPSSSPVHSAAAAVASAAPSAFLYSIFTSWPFLSVAVAAPAAWALAS